MAVQSKILVNDVGSAVVEEIASQLNRAASYGTLLGMDAPAGGATRSEFLLVCTEDVLVQQVTLVFKDGAGASGLDQDTDRVTLRTGAAGDFTGGTSVFSAVNFSGGGNNAALDVFHTPTSLDALGATVVTGSPGPWRVDAGDSFVLDIFCKAGSNLLTGRISAFVTYRTIKDELTLTPTFTQTMRNFASVGR